MFQKNVLTVQINRYNDLNIFANSRSSATNLKCFSRSLEHFFFTENQNNFGNKITISYHQRQDIYRNIVHIIQKHKDTLIMKLPAWKLQRVKYSRPVIIKLRGVTYTLC